MDKTFSAVVLTVSDGSEVALKSILRLNQSDRKEIVQLLKDLSPDKDEDKEEDGDEGIDSIERISEKTTRVIEIIAGKGARKVLKDLDGDLPLTLKIIETWMEETQAGEAERSHD